MTLPIPRVRRIDGPVVHEPLVFDNSWGTGEAGPYLVSRSYEWMSDVYVKNFHHRIARGEILSHPCAHTDYTYSHEGGWFAGTRIADGKYSNGDGPVTAHLLELYSLETGVPIQPELKAYLRREVKLEAIASIDNTPYAFGEDVGEIKTTLSYLRQRGTGILSLTKGFIRAKRRLQKSKRSGKLKPIEYASRLSDMWLEYRFALSPLVRSAYDAADAMVYEERKLPPRLTANSIRKQPETGTSTETHGYVVFRYAQNSEHKLAATILYVVTNPTRDLQWRLGLRAKDIPVTLWQLAPYSFMVDRVVNISSAISAAVNLADPNVRILAGTYSRRSTSANSIEAILWNAPGWSMAVSGGQQLEEKTTYKRYLWTPSASDIVPPVRNLRDGLVKDITNTLDLFALIKGAFSRLR